jgi:two-component system NtrC family sensor kinase
MSHQKQLKEAEKKLKKAQTQLLRAEKMAALGELVAGVAHEINTPLGALKSNNDLYARCIAKMKTALDDNTDAGRVELNDLIGKLDELTGIDRTAVDRILAIVQSLRNFARSDESEKTDMDIHAGLDSTLALVHHKLKNRVTVHRQYGNVPRISAYPNRLNQVFMNILVNASQAIEKHGDIFITTKREGDRVAIEIRDTGKGISEEDLARVCELGFTTKAESQGTGLGLAIVCRIVEDHNGTFDIKSKVGEGTMVRIVLPIAQED